MQRRRQQTPQNNNNSNNSNNNNAAPFLPPTPSTTTTTTTTNTNPFAAGNQLHSFSPAAAPPSSSLMNGGIELRDRPAHGTSSSISRPGLYQRAASSSAAAAAGSSSYQPPSYHTQPAVSDTIFIMKPLVGAMQAWSCVVISIFAIIILSILGLLFRSNHHEMVGGIEDPDNGPQVAATIFIAVLVYVGFLVFCGLQGLLHLRENRRGAIAL